MYISSDAKTRDCTSSSRRGGGYRFESKILSASELEIKICTNYCYVRFVTLVWVWGMPWPKTGAIHYNAQLLHLVEGREIQGLSAIVL